MHGNVLFLVKAGSKSKAFQADEKGAYHTSSPRGYPQMQAISIGFALTPLPAYRTGTYNNQTFESYDKRT
jgi:hypothetical protein